MSRPISESYILNDWIKIIDALMFVGKCGATFNDFIHMQLMNTFSISGITTHSFTTLLQTVPLTRCMLGKALLPLHPLCSK